MNYFYCNTLNTLKKEVYRREVMYGLLPVQWGFWVQINDNDSPQLNIWN